MRFLIVLACLCCLFSASFAEEAPLAAISKAERLDNFFSELKRAREPAAASTIAGNIRALWGDSDSATINALMTWAKKAMKEEHYPVALDFLDQAIALDPDFVESWNTRATLHYQTGNYKKSMEDIARVLSLEPRHFGALSGMAMILEQTGKDAEALKVRERILEIYPGDRESQSRANSLSEKLDGTKT